MRLEPAVPAQVLAAVRAPFLEQGAAILDAPVVQPLGQYLDIAGEAMRERLFIVQSPGGEEACLRPDFTVAAARAHIAGGAAFGRYVYEGHAFRVAPKGEERAEEFLQIGLEVFEEGDGPSQDAAIAALAWRAAAAGGRDDLTLLMGDVSLFSAFVEALDVAAPVAARLKRAFSSPRRLRVELAAAGAEAPRAPEGRDRLAVLLAGLSEADGAAVLGEIWALAGIQPVGGRSAGEIVHRLGEGAALAAAERLTPAQSGLISRFLAISDTPPAALEGVSRLAGAERKSLDMALEGWARRFERLLAQGVPEERTCLSAAFGRAFGYYDGFLFEVRSAALGDGAPAAAGGRYDSLPARLGGRLAGGAVGCTVRPGRAWIGGAA
jgi:ATP phosphoribosyltransferase regulatory subunit